MLEILFALGLFFSPVIDYTLLLESHYEIQVKEEIERDEEEDDYIDWTFCAIA
ncbi:MAG: hypothetical protein KGI54_09645 [Pseudomonadota bacterium]|nr:hypothetical protein [Pseudomonadota bacterium]